MVIFYYNKEIIVFLFDIQPLNIDHLIKLKIMISSLENTQRKSQKTTNQQVLETSSNPEPILCPHCKRTASNGIKCKGICVADDDY